MILPGVRVRRAVQLRLERHVPAGGRRRHDVGVVHQEVRTVHVRHAVHVAVDDVVGVVRARFRLQRPDHVGERREERRIDRAHVATGDQPVRCITRRRHAVVHGPAALTHQRDHLVGGVRVLHRDLAARLVFERGDPVVGRIVRAVLRVPVPGDQRERILGVADRVVGRRRRDRLVTAAVRLHPPPPSSLPHAAATSVSTPITASHLSCFFIEPPPVGPSTPRAHPRPLRPAGCSCVPTPGARHSRAPAAPPSTTS